LKVRERGKNSIQLNGGVSGIAGSFIGFSYSTNNLLGLGETLSLNSQIGTRQDNVTLGFTEPYFLDKPIQVGMTIFYTRFDYNQAREASILSGQNLTQLFSELGSQNLLNYVTNSRGFTAFISKPLRRSFARVGISYAFSIQNVTTLTNAATAYYTYIDFLRINGPNPLSGIVQSAIIPSFTYNSVNHPITPTGGKSLSVSLQYAGSFLGGNVNQILPTVDAKYFHRSPLNHKHIIGAHLLGKFVTGYDGKVAPPLNRFYMGGENDIRGFDIWSISPVAYIPTSASVNILNNDGTPRQQREIINGATTYVNVTQVIPSYQLVTPGGDLEAVSNFEYRIPIYGPVILAAFLDAGMDRLALSGQLKLNADRVSQLDTLFPEAAFPDRAIVAAGTQKIRMSTGLEIQVMLPVVNAPFRIYWAYNPLRVEEYVQQPIVADRSYFPNAASFFNSIAQVGQQYGLFERPSSFRFTIGRTF
jgi:outer membrane protein insertion porin family